MTSAELLVLGSGGRIGHLLRALRARDPSVMGPGLALPGAVLWQSRRGGPGRLAWAPGADLPPALSARTVLCLWGVTSGEEEVLAQNVPLALAAQRLARRIGADRVLHLSSAAVVAGHAGAHAGAIPDDAPPAPLTAYGRAKALAEKELSASMRRHPDGPRAVLLRLGNLLGADSLSAAMIRARGAPVTLDRFADGTGPVRPYLGAADLAHVLGLLCALPHGALPARLNLAGPSPVAMEDIVVTAGLPLAWRPAPDGALHRLALDTSGLQALAGPLPGSATAAGLLAQWPALTVPA